VREVRGLGEDVLRGHLDELGEGAVVREAQDAVLLAGLPRVVAPVERRVDYHLGSLVRAVGTLAAGDDLAGAVRAQDDRQRLGPRARVLAVGDEDVAAVEGRGAEPDDRLAGTGLRLGDVLVAELVWAAELVQHHRFHRRSLRSVLGYTFQLITNRYLMLLREHPGPPCRWVPNATDRPDYL
jgi:hypothetical protein